jgi:dynein heavy chain
MMEGGVTMCGRYSKLAVKMERMMPPNPVVKRLKGMVTVLADTLPVIQNMRNPALKDRHWKKMEALIGRKVSNNNNNNNNNNNKGLQ